MRKQIVLDGFSLHIFEDTHGDPSSADVPTNYDDYYFPEDLRYRMTGEYGIGTKDLEGETIKQVCIGATGGRTTIHDKGFVLTKNHLTICCADTVFSLSLPGLSLRWKVQADIATAFEIFEHNGGFIIHGELAITKLDDAGNVVWRFIGPDIFSTLEEKDDFRFTDDWIHAASWENGVFVLNANTAQVVAHEL